MGSGTRLPASDPGTFPHQVGCFAEFDSLNFARNRARREDPLCRSALHARYYWLLLGESHLTKLLFGSMLGRIARLSLPAG
jgi:hypothetical protein